MAIYRPLDIVGSVRTGAWSTSTEMAALIRYIADTGLAPDIDLPLDFVAADTCAAAIRHISVTVGAAGRTYHLASSETAPLATLVGRLRDKGYQIAEVPFDDWVRELARQAARDPSHPMAAFLPLFVGQVAAWPHGGRNVPFARFPGLPPVQYRARAARQRHSLPARQRGPA